MWKIAGHTLGTPGMSVPEAMVLFADAGLDAAEIIWQDGYTAGIPEDDGGATVAAVDRAQRVLRLPVIGLTPYMSGLNALDEDLRRADLGRFRRCLADAERLGAGVVRVYAGSYGPDEVQSRPAKWARLVRSLRELAPDARAAGVTLVVENHFNTMTMSAADTADLVREVDHESVAVLYDQANLTFTHSEPWERAMELQAPWVRHVHVKDLVFTHPDRPFSASSVATVAGEERAVASRVVGDGILDWPAILDALRRADYAGHLSLEYEYRWHPQDLPEPAIGFRRGAERLREMMGTPA